MQRVVDEIKAAVDRSKAPAGKAPAIYAVKDYAKLHDLKVNLMRSIELSNTRLAKQRQQIEEGVNRPFADRRLQAAREVRLASGAERSVDIDEALRLFLHADTALYRQRNPALNDKDVVGLVKNIQAYLEDATYHQHLTRFVAAIERLEKKKEALAPEEDIRQAVQEVTSIAAAYRAYDVAKHPEYLVFEYYMNILMRKDQAENLDKLVLKGGKIGAPQNIGAVIEMIMGAGKTSVLLPLLSLLNADGSKLAIGVLPDVLITSMAPEVQKTLGLSFKQVLEVLECRRDTKLEAPQLQRLLERLQRIVDERRVLLMGKSSLHSLYLKFAEKLHLYSTNAVSGTKQEALLGEIKLFQKVIGLLKASGNALVDEVDNLMNPLQSSHYTIGSATGLDPVYGEAAADLFSLLASDAAINQSIRLGFSKTPGATPFTKDHYDKAVKPMLAKAVLEGKLSPGNKALQAFIKSLNKQEQHQLEDFLLNRDGQKGSKLLKDRAEPYVQDLLALYKEQFNELLPLTLTKNLNEHFGKNPDNMNDHCAMPYKNGEAQRREDFGTALEKLNYSFLMHLTTGLPTDIVAKEVQRLATLFTEERLKDPTMKFEDLPSYRRFMKMGGGGRNMYRLSPEDLKAITDAVNRNPQMQIELIVQHVIPEIKVYQNQLNADAQVFGFLFKNTDGMSGTLWNKDTFPIQMRQTYLSDTMAKTLKLLWEHSPPHVDVLGTPKAGNEMESLIKQLYNRSGLLNGSIIDAAGLLRDVPDRADVAEAMLRMECWKGTAIKGVAFYDKRDRLMVMTFVNGKRQVVELSKTPLAKEEIIAFWDQQHTTGSDIKLGAHMTAAVSVGRHTLLRDLMQAVWRLRGLDQAQRVNFVVAAEDAEIIKATLKQSLGISVSGELELKHLLLYVINNQAERLGSDNYRALKQKMQALVLDKVLKAILDPNISEQALSKLFSGCSELFASATTARPFDIYGGTKATTNSKEVVAADVAELINGKAMQTIRNMPELFGRQAGDALEKEIKAMAESHLALVPEQLVKSEGPGYGMQRTTQVEKQKEVEVEVQKQTQKSLATGAELAIVFHPPTTWDKKNLFTRGYFLPNAVDSSIRNFFRSVGAPSWLLDIFGGREQGRPILAVADALGNTAGMEKAGSHFVRGLLASTSLWPDTAYATPFGFAQKEVNYAVVIKDKKTAELKLMLLDGHDAAAFKQILTESWEVNKRENPDREVDLMLYHFDSDTAVPGQPGDMEAKVKKDPQFLKLKVLAKFFRGDSNYNKEELSYLEPWLKAGDVKALYTLFTQKILLWKDESRARFPGSPLDRLFTNLGVSE